MLNVISWFYLTTLIFLGCDNIYFLGNIHDINVLIAFTSLAFLSIIFVHRKDVDKIDFKTGYLGNSLILLLLYTALSFNFSLDADLSGYPALKNLSAIFLSLALIFYLKNIEVIKKVMFCVFIFAGIHAGIGILQQFVPALLHQPERFRFAASSFFTNPNYYSSYLLIHIPVGFYLMTCSRVWKMPLAGMWVMIWIALGFSGSPGGQLIAGIQVLGMIIYLLKKKDIQNLKYLGGCLLLALLVYIGLASNIHHTADAQAVAGSLVRRPWVWQHIENRFIYWTGAWSLFTEYWLLGSGLWTFVEFYPQMGLMYSPPHAHNLYLQTAAETGLIGFSLLMFCLTILFFTVVKTFRKARPETRDINFYISVSLSGLLLHNLIEYNWLTANFIFYFVFFIISVEVLNRETQRPEESNGMATFNGLWPKVIPVILVLGLFTIVQYYRYHRILGHDILFSNSVNEMATHTAKAKEICNKCGRPHYLSGIVRLEAFRQTQDKQNLIRAEMDFNEVIKRNPRSMGTYLKLGETKSLQGNFEEAKKYYEIAMKDERYRTSALTGLSKLDMK